MRSERTHGAGSCVFWRHFGGSSDGGDVTSSRSEPDEEKRRWGHTPLSIAAEAGAHEVISVLLRHSTEALHNGHHRTVQLLLDSGAAMDAMSYAGETALYWASINGHASTVQLLLDNGAATEHARGQDFTPLLGAIDMGRIDAVRVLLARGADVNATTMTGQSSLTWACQLGHAEIVRLLLENGAAPDSSDWKAQVPWWWAENPQHDEVMDPVQQYYPDES